MKWKTLICEWNKNHSFCDSQLRGPYKRWNHTHLFEEVGGKTLMSDEVIMKPPLGILGWLIFPFILKDVKEIFSYRRKVISELV